MINEKLENSIKNSDEIFLKNEKRLEKINNKFYHLKLD